MLLLKNSRRLSGAMLSLLAMLGLPSFSEAQPAVHTLQTTLGVCRGEINVLSQQQTPQSLDMEVQVTIADCDGNCEGSIEYMLVFTDANNNEIQWQMNKTWPWRKLDGPITLQLHHDILPGSTLKDVKNMKLGRCSCSS